MSKSSLPSRRFLLVSVAATLAGSALGWPGRALSAGPPPLTADGTFTRSTVTEIARGLSKRAFVPPTKALPDAIGSLTYDQYQAIHFRPEAAVWAKDGLPFQMQPLHRGLYYDDKIELAIVSDGEAHHLAYSPAMYAPCAIVTRPLPNEDIGFAGFRLHGHINRPDVFDEIVVFEGASYFRSLGKGQVYGISARGLALQVGAPGGEEFPIFRAFWVEAPTKDSDSIVVHALLDSKSVSGAYRFTIRPGLPNTMDVEATLFPRVDLDSAGLAPGTSMFYFDGNGREGFETGGQSYEKRPSLWVEPVGDWGKGSVVLVEIPSESEVNDNIVAYWLPQDPLRTGAEFAYAYRLFWGTGPTLPGMIVAATRRGRGDLKHTSRSAGSSSTTPRPAWSPQLPIRLSRRWSRPPLPRLRRQSTRRCPPLLPTRRTIRSRK